MGGVCSHEAAGGAKGSEGSLAGGVGVRRKAAIDLADFGERLLALFGAGHVGERTPG